MRKRGVSCVGFLLCVFLTAGFAEGSDGPASMQLGLEEAVRLALAGNGDLQKQKKALDLAELKADSAWNVFLPSLSLSGTYSDAQAFSRDIILKEPNADLGVSAGLSLSLNAGLGETIRQTVLASESARLSWRQAEASLVRTVRKAYYALVTDLASLEVGEKNLLLAKAQEDLVSRNYRSGLASELEYLQAQYTAASLEPDLIQKKNKYAGALRSFNLLLGLPLESRLRLTDAVSASDAIAALPAQTDSLVEKRYDVRLAALNVEKAKSAALGNTLGRYAPSITVSESARVSGLLEERKMPETGTFSLTVNIPLNGYLPGSKEMISGAEKAGDVELAEIALAQTRLAARQETGALYDTLSQLSEAIRLNRLGEKLAVRAYELSGQGYGSGLVTQAELDTARQKLLAAQLNVPVSYTHLTLPTIYSV